MHPETPAFGVKALVRDVGGKERVAPANPATLYSTEFKVLS